MGHYYSELIGDKEEPKKNPRRPKGKETVWDDIFEWELKNLSLVRKFLRRLAQWYPELVADGTLNINKPVEAPPQKKVEGASPPKVLPRIDLTGVDLSGEDNG